ncbi:MAG: DUF72 domain-containing protein [Reyranellaceae bacterium]
MQPEAQTDLFAEPEVDVPALRRNVVVGTCSWSDPSLIKSKAFYPKATNSAEARLRYYASQFPVVEVDSSYFAMPSPTNSALWAERTPPGFVFTMKAFRIFTGHQTPPEAFPADIKAVLPPLTGRKKNYYYADLPDEIRAELWRRFLMALAPLKQAGKLRAAHLQFAPWVTNSPDWRAHVEMCVDRMKGHQLAVEFRNQTWLEPQHVADTLAWERDLGVVHVIVDEPQGVGNFAHGVWEVTYPDLAIVRLHGRNADTWNKKGLAASSERFDYEYSDSELIQLARQIEDLMGLVGLVIVLLNVNKEDQGIRAARKLQQILDAGERLLSRG